MRKETSVTNVGTMIETCDNRGVPSGVDTLVHSTGFVSRPRSSGV
jgi:hypothetical protein